MLCKVAILVGWRECGCVTISGVLCCPTHALSNAQDKAWEVQGGCTAFCAWLMMGLAPTCLHTEGTQLIRVHGLLTILLFEGVMLTRLNSKRMAQPCYAEKFQTKPCQI